LRRRIDGTPDANKASLKPKTRQRNLNVSLDGRSAPNRYLQIHPDRIEAGDGHEWSRSLNALAGGAVPRYDCARHGRAHNKRAYKSTILTQRRDFALGHSDQRQQLRAFLENGVCPFLGL
jgi:hypothetical protein